MRDNRYATFRVIAETKALDIANDVAALSHEGRVHLMRAHEAHVKDDWPRYLHASSAVDRKLVAIGAAAREWSGTVLEAPSLTPGQLELMLCPDSEGPGHGRAA